MLCSLGQGVVKVTASVFAGVGVALLIVGYFSFQDAQAWDPQIVDRYGPPLGPTLTAVGAGFVTAAGLMGVLFFPGGCKRLVEK